LYYTNRGVAYGKNEEHDKAIEDFTKAIELDPKNALYYGNKAIVLRNRVKNEINNKTDGKWIKEANEYYKQWIAERMIDYSTSMNIYLLRDLLLQQNNKKSITEIEGVTKKYIEAIVKCEHDKNKENSKKLLKDENDRIILYQYSPYNKNAIYRIKNQQIYFSDPSTFNDPFDPLIRVLDKEHSEGLMKLLKFRVSCLSLVMDNILLWSHYADKHQGICIAYDITELIKNKKIIFRKIDYIKSFPKPQNGLIFSPLENKNIKSDDSTTITETFMKKEKSWGYEEEYRLILQSDKEEDYLQKADIKAVYLGRNMSTVDEEFIKTMIGEMNTKKEIKDNIEVYKMQISDDDIFKLEIPEN